MTLGKFFSPKKWTGEVVFFFLIKANMSFSSYINICAQQCLGISFYENIFYIYMGTYRIDRSVHISITYFYIFLLIILTMHIFYIHIYTHICVYICRTCFPLVSQIPHSGFLCSQIHPFIQFPYSTPAQSAFELLPGTHKTCASAMLILGRPPLSGVVL